MICLASFYVGFRTASKKYPGAFRRELPGDLRADRTPGAEDNCVLSMQNCCVTHVILLRLMSIPFSKRLTGNGPDTLLSRLTPFADGPTSIATTSVSAVLPYQRSEGTPADIF